MTDEQKQYCDIVFRAHFNTNNSLVWTRQTFEPRTNEKHYEARRILEDMGVLNQRKSKTGRAEYTSITHPYLGAKSFDDLEKILSEKSKPIPVGNTFNIANSPVGNINTGTVGGDQSSSANLRYNKTETKKPTSMGTTIINILIAVFGGAVASVIGWYLIKWLS